MQPIGDRLPGSELAALASSARIGAHASSAARAGAVASAATDSSAHAAGAARDGHDVKSAAQDFEALFATMLVKEMRKALPEGFFGGEAEGDVYGGWFDEQMGRKIAEGGALHLAEALEASFIRRASPSTAASASTAPSTAVQRRANATSTPEVQP